jgi:methylated-DNA-[protein]-cysteine S-methyltransferase
VTPLRLEFAVCPSPIGPLTLAAGPQGLCRIDFGDDPGAAREALLRRFAFGAPEWVESQDPGGAATALERYFAGELRALDALAIDPGGSAFQRSVWLALRLIRPGTTWSYSELARHVGRPQAVRAVGAANGSNPLPLVLPCHRVIGADGRLVGYGGGLEMKAWLLRHEGALL